MDIVKINNNLYCVYELKDGKRETLKIIIPEISSPFGLENYQGVTYLNLEIDNKKSYHSQLLGDLYKIEDYFINYVYTIDKKIEWCSSIRKKNQLNPLWKVRFRKQKKHFTIEHFIDNKMCTWDEMLSISNNLKIDCTMEIILQSLWIKNNKAGLIWNINKIYC